MAANDETLGGEELQEFVLSGPAQKLLQAHLEVEENGFLGKDLTQKVADLLKRDRAFEIPEHPIELTRTKKEFRDRLLHPQAFNELKLPSVAGFMGDSGSKFEQPLFEQSLMLRRVLIPLSAISVLLEGDLEEEDFNLLGVLVRELRSDIIERLRNLSLQRLAAKLPDKEARTIVLADKDSILRSESAKGVLKSVKDVKKMTSAVKPRTLPKGLQERRRTEDATKTTTLTEGPAATASSQQHQTGVPKNPSRARGGLRGKRK
jgi:hypothetical protein